MYKLQLNKDFITNEIKPSVAVLRLSDNACIPFDPANIDYANFKTAILEDKAQLEDSDGNLMTAEQAKQFVSTLP
jgi:hypothetical protein